MKYTVHVPPKEGVFYRIGEIQYGHGPELFVEVLYMIRETPKGFWISTDPHYKETGEAVYYIGDRLRWVSKTARKRYAYPTLEEALENFRARKRRQIEILSYRLERARAALGIAKGETIEERLQRYLR